MSDDQSELARAKAQAEIIHELLPYLPAPQFLDVAEPVDASATLAERLHRVLAAFKTDRILEDLKLYVRSASLGIAPAVGFAQGGENVPATTVIGDGTDPIRLEVPVPSGHTHGAVLLIADVEPSRLQLLRPAVTPPVDSVPDFSLSRARDGKTLVGNLYIGAEPGRYLLLVVTTSSATAPPLPALADFCVGALPPGQALAQLFDDLAQGSARVAHAELAIVDRS